MSLLPVRYIENIGTRAYLIVMWENDQLCTTGHKYHRAEVELGRSDKAEDWGFAGDLSDHYNKPTAHLVCERCHQPQSGKIDRGLGHGRIYSTSSGKPEPGDVYYVRLHAPNEHCHHRWSNCNGMHLHAVTPPGIAWDVDGRASNCTMKDETTHRCWVRHGDPAKGEPMHVDKQGPTCAAGAGSIVVDGYHGFLHVINGVSSFISC